MPRVQDVLLPILGGVAGLNPYLGSGIRSALSVQEALREGKRREEEMAERKREEEEADQEEDSEKNRQRRSAISVGQMLDPNWGPDVAAIRDPLLSGDPSMISPGLQILRERRLATEKKTVEDALKGPEEEEKTQRLLWMKSLGDDVRTALPTDHPNYKLAERISDALYNGDENFVNPGMKLLASLGEQPTRGKDQVVSLGKGWSRNLTTGEDIEPPPGYDSGGPTPEDRVRMNNALATAETKLGNLQKEMDFVLRVQHNPAFTGETPKDQAKVTAIRGREAQEIERIKGLMKYEYDTINTIKSQGGGGGRVSGTAGGANRTGGKTWRLGQDNSLTQVQ